jgi:hypothetical protein
MKSAVLLIILLAAAVIGVLWYTNSAKAKTQAAVNAKLASSPANSLGQGVATLGTQVIQGASKAIAQWAATLFGPTNGTPSSGPGGAVPTVNQQNGGAITASIDGTPSYSAVNPTLDLGSSLDTSGLYRYGS